MWIGLALMTALQRTPELPDVGQEVQAECMALALLPYRRRAWKHQLDRHLLDTDLCEKAIDYSGATTEELHGEPFETRLEYVKSYMRNHP